MRPREQYPVPGWLVLHMDGTVDLWLSSIPPREKRAWLATRDDIRALPETRS